MVYAPKELRNQSLVAKRIKDPKTWTWAKLGEHFEMHRSVAKEIFERDMEKFAHEHEIEAYVNKMKKLNYSSKEKQKDEIEKSKRKKI
jgi:hypothetical protein